MINQIVDFAPFFLLVAARCAGLIFTLPFFSMRTVSRVAKVAFVGYLSYLLMSYADFSAYKTFINGDGAFTLYYIALIAGEAMIGVIIGFYVSMILAAFSTGAQFFAFQMGFSAASTYDSLSQVENPLLGQYFNLVAMIIFMQNKWFQKLFIQGLAKSLETLNVFALIDGREKIMAFLLKGLTELFADALIISLPVMGILLLITICTGLLSKAAPQMNLLSEGFPIMILLAFLLISMMFNSLCNFFANSFESGFAALFSLLKAVGKDGS